MQLKVVGAGLGRTGTASLKNALERLTGGPCYHMFEVQPESVAAWNAAARGEPVDWDTLMRGYTASVDWPAAAFWPELSAANPDGVVLLSTRATPEQWWASMERTIVGVLSAEVPPEDQALSAHRAMVRDLFAQRFTPAWRDPEAAMAAYTRHNERVRSEVPAERLVEWQPGDGWEPICAALGAAVPSAPFPHENTTAAFRARMADSLGSENALTTVFERAGRRLAHRMAPAMDTLVQVDAPTPSVRQLTLNRPDQLNAMTAELCEQLHEQLRSIAGDRSCRAVILTGAGRAFCAGVDLRGYGAAPGNDGSDEPRDRLINQQHMSTLVLGLRELPQPVIAAVNGPAAGLGFALTLGCDIRYAAPEAVFRAAFINIGVSNCDMGTSWLLPRLIGASRAHEMMLTGRRVDAEEALAIGLLADVVDQPRLLERAVEAAEQIASLAPWGVRLTKQGMWAALEIPSEQASVEYEDRQQIMATFSRGLPEAVGAFLEKRPAEFAD